MYKLIKASQNNIEILIQYKLKTIYSDATNFSEAEKTKIKNYVISNIPKQIKNYKIVYYEEKIIGCVLVEPYEDGYLLDEIYLEEDYRNQGIGSKIIEDIIKRNKRVYLWVYKNNEKAIKLYLKIGFEIINQSETRYQMLCNK